MKKIIALLLAFIFLFSLCACGGEEQQENDSSIIFKTDKSVGLGEPFAPLDPKQVYENLTYTEDFFIGDRRLKGGDSAIAVYRNEMDYIDFEGDYFNSITAIPHRIEVGVHTLNHVITNIKEYKWLRAHFETEKGNLHTLLCAYEVEGNKITLKPVNKLETKNGKISYSFRDITLEYEFAFKGNDLTLTRNSKSVTLSGGLDISTDQPYISVDHYLKKESANFLGINELTMLYSPQSGYINFYLRNNSKNIGYFSAVGKMTDDGLFTFTLEHEGQTKTYQFVYFYGYKDGIIFTDGKTTYYFTDTYSDRNRSDISEYISEDLTGSLEVLTDAQLENLVKKKDALLKDLSDAFSNEGIKVTVDAEKGELAMDSSVLFGGDSAIVTDEGKAFLKKFIKAYISVIYSDEYKDFVSQTMIEGHVAPVGGTYESGLYLSTERAGNVKAFCLSEESGIKGKYISDQSKKMVVVGYSNSRPVYGDDGEVDYAASRRVSFRFIINLNSLK